MGELQVLSHQVSHHHHETDTTLKIAAIPSALHGWLASVLSVFSSRYPEAMGLVLEGVEEEIKEWVESGVVDVGITTDTTRLNLGYWREHFDWQLIRQDEIVAVLPSSHPLSQHASVSVSALAEHPLVMSSGGCEALIQQIFANSLEASEGVVQVDFWVRDTRTLLQMVANGVGVSLVPTLALVNKLNADLVTRSLSPCGVRQLIAFWPKKKPLGPVGQQLLQACGA